MSSYNTKLYFTYRPASYKTFYDGVDYVINPSNNHVIAGALTKEECKSLVYNLPNGINYSINGKKQCEAGLSQIEFLK